MTDPRLKPIPVTLIHELLFSELVRTVHGRPYRFQQQQFNAQESIVQFTVPSRDLDDEGPSFEDWLAATPPSPGEADYFSEVLRWERVFYPCFGDVVNDFQARGLIDGGRYALHIWW